MSQLIDSCEDEQRWTDNPAELYQDLQWAQIFPRPGYSANRKFNALSRLIIFCAVGLTLTQKSYKYLEWGAVLLLLQTWLGKHLFMAIEHMDTATFERQLGHLNNNKQIPNKRDSTLRTEIVNTPIERVYGARLVPNYETQKFMENEVFNDQVGPQKFIGRPF